MKYTFPKTFRILKRKDFKEIASRHRRFVGEALVIDSRLAEEAKLGITVVRQFGNAVERNLFKRRVRETFRKLRCRLEPYEIIVMPKKGAQAFSLEMIAKDLSEFNCVAQSSATKSR